MISFHTGYAGLLSVACGNVTLHFLPTKNRLWGRHMTWYDGPFYEWGLGPIFLVCWY